MDLTELREKLTDLDRRIIELVAERQRLGHEVGKVKRDSGQSTRDYARERIVLESAKNAAGELGVSPKLATDIMGLLIQSSLTTQEQQRVAAHGVGVGKRALVIGGAGKMGGWFVRYMQSQGFEVEIGDPHAADGVDWEASDLDQDVIVVATPLGITPRVLQLLASRQPPGLIFDLGSIKKPLQPGFEALQSAGCRATSIHPMFGPGTELLSKRHIIFVDLGTPQATADAKELFAPTMAELVDMTLEDHDRLIAYVLGLSHALNISFFTALAASGEKVPRLAQLSSTTFDAQLQVASAVAQDSPDLYYEIQALNPHGEEARRALEDAVKRLNQVIFDADKSQFVELMQSGLSYFYQRAQSSS